MASGKGQKKRFWSDEEKRSICAQTQVGGVSVAHVARRYAMNSNLIFTWLRDPRFSPEVDEAEHDTVFLPVELDGAAVTQDAGIVIAPDTAVVASRVDITLSDGRRIVVEGPTALSAVVGLVQGLMA